MSVIDDTAAWIELATVDSTQLAARRWLQSHTHQPTHAVCILAAEQTAGRGRGGNAWQSHVGNMYLTLLIPPHMAALSHLAAQSALAIRDALLTTLSPIDHTTIQLKWPNDVLMYQRKVAGLLIEQDDASSPYILGMGVNLLSHPSSTRWPATHVAEHVQHVPTPQQLAHKVVQSLDHWLQQPLAHVTAAWSQQMIHRRGDQLTVRLPQKEIQGIFEGFTADGALRLAVDGQPSLIVHSAEVFAPVRPPSSSL